MKSYKFRKLLNIGGLKPTLQTLLIAICIICISGCKGNQRYNMIEPRQNHKTIPLANDKLLIIGCRQTGESNYKYFWQRKDKVAEIFDPKSKKFVQINNTNYPACIYEGGKHSPNAVILKNKKVLIVGKYGAELFNPATNSFSPTGNLHLFPFKKGTILTRDFDTATLLSNGKVLIAGGAVKNKYGGYSPTVSTEIYDPTTGKFSIASNMAIPRYNHQATLLLNGKVLITGGITNDKGGMSFLSANAEIYDPVINKFFRIGNMYQSRSMHKSVLLNNGKVLILGGGVGFISNKPYRTTVQSTSRAELFDPITSKFRLIGNMIENRGTSQDFSALLLPDDRVLISGGNQIDYFSKSLRVFNPKSMEIYDAVMNTFIKSKDILYARKGHQMDLTESNRVIITGGTQTPSVKPEFYLVN